MLERLAAFCFNRRRLVLGVWVALLFGLFAASGAIGAAYHTDFRLAGT